MRREMREREGGGEERESIHREYDSLVLRTLLEKSRRGLVTQPYIGLSLISTHPRANVYICSQN